MARFHNVGALVWHVYIGHDMNNLIKMARTKSIIDTNKDGEFFVKITGIPTDKETDGSTIGAMRIVLMYDALENWCKERFNDDELKLSDLVEDARKQLRLKSRYSPSKVT